MLKIGILGFGKMGKIRHQEIISRKGVQIASIYDPHYLISEKHVAKSADEIINNPDIDAVFICTPNHLN